MPLIFVMKTKPHTDKQG